MTYLLPLLLLFSHLAAASDLVREQHLGAQLEADIRVGAPLRLDAKGLSFLAIHTRAETKTTRGAAILLHGMGANPDWSEVIQPLRIGLPERGWETLSLQMPIGPADATAAEYLALVPEAAPRIDAAVTFLTQQRQIFNIVLIGHDLGARMGVEFVAAGSAPLQLRALVAIGLSAEAKRPRKGTLEALSKIHMPLLDIYGTRGLDTVVQTARERSEAARSAQNSAYRQMEVVGADHFFRGLEETLLLRVSAWMSRMASATEVEAP